MEDDGDGDGEVGREAGDEPPKGLGAAGGDADGDEVDPACVLFDLQGSEGYRRDLKEAEARGCLGCRLHLSDQFVADLVDLVGGQGSRLVDEVDRPGVQCFQGHIASLAGDAHHYHRQRAAGHLLVEEGHPVHPRHLKVQRHHIGAQLLHQFQRLFAVVRRPHNLDERVAGKDLAQHLAYIG